MGPYGVGLVLQKELQMYTIMSTGRRRIRKINEDIALAKLRELGRGKGELLQATPSGVYFYSHEDHNGPKVDQQARYNSLRVFQDINARQVSKWRTKAHNVRGRKGQAEPNKGRGK